MNVAGIVLAAGEGRRFGGPKQLAELDGRPLLGHAVQTLREVCDRVVVVLGARAEEVRRGVPLDGVEVVVCADWEEGTFASLRCGLAALGDGPDAVVVALGDQPFLSAERIGAVLAHGGEIARARDGGAPSHPVVIRRGATVTSEALKAAAGPEMGPLGDVDTRQSLRELGT
jgi:CTP:molybdopterin cytidylyltransferase MocA